MDQDQSQAVTSTSSGSTVQSNSSSLAAENSSGNAESSQLSKTDEESATGYPDCPVCLQQCIYPVRLPCSHIFCFLCIKGVAGRNRRCALCRAEIPQTFVRRPVLMSKDAVRDSVAASSDDASDTNAEDSSKFRWYYEGVGGWWRYDERTNAELEKQRDRYMENRNSSLSVFELLIAGFIYVIDLDNGVQYRRGNPARRRRIKRDLADISDCKGVAGLVCRGRMSERRDADGTDNSAAGGAVGGHTVLSQNSATAVTVVPATQSQRPPISSMSSSHTDDVHGPHVPSLTDHNSVVGAVGPSATTPSSVSGDMQSQGLSGLVSRMSAISLSGIRHRRRSDQSSSHTRDRPSQHRDNN